MDTKLALIMTFDLFYIRSWAGVSINQLASHPLQNGGSLKLTWVSQNAIAMQTSFTVSVPG